jgi:hypothetical protein
VSEFDEATSEITLDLENNKYNQVLKRPSKFSVILDETDKENAEQEQEQEIEQRRDSQDADNTVR